VRLDASQTEESSRELGDVIEPGSSVEVSGIPSPATGGEAGLDQLKGLRDSGLIDAEAFALIEATMTNPTAELDRLHASGVISDEIYAQACASMPAATSGSGPAADAADLDLLQNGESATATVLAPPSPSGEAGAGLLRLEVHPAAGAPYEVGCTVPTVHPGGKLKAGDFLRVKVDPAHPKRVAIDWTAFGT
jgi:hypothetical protein